MKTGYTHIQVVLDRSGSMASIKNDTEGGFNTFIKEQAQLPGKATVGLFQFDTVYDEVYPPTDIDKVPPLVLTPRGGTALLDAMGRCITTTGEWLAALPEDQRPEKVIFVVITDGEENSSREWTREQVFNLITEQTEKYGWDFVFLAANQDAIQTGATYGIAKGSSLTYDVTKVGQTYSTLSAAVTNTRTVGGATHFSDEDRKNTT